MCFKKQSPTPIIPVSERNLLSFTINDYPGSVNDLNGCNNDGKQVKATLLNYWPDFGVKRFIDSQATLKTFKSEVANAISNLKPGSTVLILPDSCFSGDVTRSFDMGFIERTHPTRNRFHKTPEVPFAPNVNVKTFISKAGINWIVISGCGSTQYSADAYIDSEYHGAFTYYAMKTLKPGITYQQWFAEIHKCLPSAEYEQAPTIEGPAEMLERIVFESETLVIHNSTHGTELQGVNGEVDQAICLYDGNLRDKEYYSLLQKIPA